MRRMKEALELSTAQSGVGAEDLHKDLLTIMHENNAAISQQFPPGTFRRLFWDQQLESAQKGPTQMRWHPTMIRFGFMQHACSHNSYTSYSTK